MFCADYDSLERTLASQNTKKVVKLKYQHSTNMRCKPKLVYSILHVLVLVSITIGCTKVRGAKSQPIRTSIEKKQVEQNQETASTLLNEEVQVNEPVTRVPYREVKTPATPAAETLEKYISLLKGKRIGLVVNHTSMVGKVHLVDTLRRLNIQIKAIFAPEHGFRGTADAGEKIKSGLDLQTGLPVISLYGSKKAPSADDLKNIDILVFDIQDVGTRFYTYLSTLYYVLDAASEQNKPVLILDRPNPNGHYTDGPVLAPEQYSFVGVVPVPMVHGCTLGEMANMMQGENWLKSGKKCPLTVITCENYTHKTAYDVPIAPSPNLRTARAIQLYPTLCLFEGTEISVGRGTDTPFELYGSPMSKTEGLSFTPVPKPGAQSPPHLNKKCNGRSLIDIPVNTLRAQAAIDWNVIKTAYANYTEPNQFFLKSNFFDRLSGNQKIRSLIKANATAEQIRDSYKTELNAYNTLRNKYLLYE
jgi:uncharacterized protein YbbC (DUF1343 family)